MRKIATIFLLFFVLSSLCIFVSAEQAEPAAKPLYLGDPGYSWPAVSIIPDDGQPPEACAHGAEYPQRFTYFCKQEKCILTTYQAWVCPHCRLIYDREVYEWEIHHVGDCLHTGNERFICSACAGKWDKP